jgi:hypothetical protein
MQSVYLMIHVYYSLCEREHSINKIIVIIEVCNTIKKFICPESQVGRMLEIS